MYFCPYNSHSWTLNDFPKISVRETEREVYEQTEDIGWSRFEFFLYVPMTSVWMNLLQTSLLHKSPGLTCLWGALWPLWVHLSAEWALSGWKDWIQCYWSVWALFLNQELPCHRNYLVKNDTLLHVRQQGYAVKLVCVVEIRTRICLKVIRINLDSSAWARAWHVTPSEGGSDCID